MPNVSFPAKLVVTEEIDLDGVPILTADFTVVGDTQDIPLPGGEQGADGPRGRPRATFLKMGQIANEASRPTGLTANDRGTWWHRVDSNGMDVWCGDHWAHSPNTVGVTGPVAPANVLTVLPTNSDPKATKAGVRVRGSSSVQSIEGTVPAGERGPKGPNGVSGPIRDSPDYDDSIGPSSRSMFAWNRGSRDFRVQDSPNGFGPWTLAAADFNPDFIVNGQYITTGDRGTVATLTIPPLPFAWRPTVHGQARVFTDLGGAKTFAIPFVRIGSPTGQIVASGLNVFGSTGKYIPTELSPMFGDPQSKSLSPTSKYASIPAWREVTLFVTIERQSGSAYIGFEKLDAGLHVWAQPI